MRTSRPDRRRSEDVAPRRTPMFQATVGAGLLLSLGFALTVTPPAWSQPKHELKPADFVGDQHAMSQWLSRWSDKLEKGSGGRIAIKRFPASQTGPVQQLVRLQLADGGSKRNTRT